MRSGRLKRSHAFLTCAFFLSFARQSYDLSTAPLQYGIHMRLAVLVGCLEIVQLLLQVRDLRLDIGCLFRLSLLHIFSRRKHKPSTRKQALVSSRPHGC